ncbi:hypothetical protein LZZ90_07160 [Flavobacterium sp. SM15]|uniref:hypothetical protein n=1 Tax=Flavobacterium sp. SM15 TaxID=2908005 RepID=UPI001EDA3C5C|nr:hypothetical protein [Flavobacterium sp. SM15]MCG2611281.1 hypothetical protein [Flavobacterium sp. SM15]
MDFIVLVLIVVLGLAFISSFRNELSPLDLSQLKKLLFYHFVFGAYYCFFVRGDAKGYWETAKMLSPEEFEAYFSGQKGTYFLFALNYYPSNVLGLSYFTGTMLYSLLGFIGLTYFYVTAIKLVPYNSKYKEYTLFPLLFFMPNLHFWSCAVGKDTLLFFCIGIFVYGIMDIFRRLPFLALSLVLSYFIRPHITLFLVVSFGLAYVMGSKVSKGQRLIFSIALIGIGFVILPSVMEFARIEEATVDSFEQFSENKASLLSRGSTGSRIDISSYPFPLKVFTFLFRPLFFDINGIPAVLASFENLFLLLVTINIFKSSPLKTFKAAPFVIKGLVFFLIIGTLAFSQSLGNLGIMIRMRNMFLPGLIIFILWAFSYRKELELKRKN